MTNLLRVIAVSLIVCGHFGFFQYGGGGAYTLMLLAGVTYAHYIVPKLSNVRIAHEAHFLLILKITLPTIFYVLVLQALSDQPVNWQSIFLISSYYGPVAPSYWFIEIYIQINLLFLLISLIPSGANALRTLKDFIPALILMFGLVLVSGISRMFWDTEELFNRVPNQLAWMFAAGIVYARCTTFRHRLIFFLSCVISGQALWGFGNMPPFMFIALLALLVLPTIKVPEFLASPINIIATSSLMIYLTHSQWGNLWSRLFGTSAMFSAVVFALIGGVVFQYVYNFLWFKFKSVLTKKAIQSNVPGK